MDIIRVEIYHKFVPRSIFHTPIGHAGGDKVDYGHRRIQPSYLEDRKPLHARHPYFWERYFYPLSKFAETLIN